MKTHKRKKIPLYATILVSALIILVGAVSVFALVNNDNSSQNTPESTESSKQSSDDKKEFIENTDENGQPKTDEEQESDSTVDFTLSEDDDLIIVQTQLTNITGGECTLTVGDYSVSASVLFQPQFSTCEGFTVKKSDINTSDTFTLTVMTGDESFTSTKRLGE